MNINSAALITLMLIVGEQALAQDQAPAQQCYIRVGYCKFEKAECGLPNSLTREAVEEFFSNSRKAHYCQVRKLEE
jgi:hypothetical protein